MEKISPNRDLNLGLHHTMQMTYHLTMLATKPPLQSEVGGQREAKSGEIFSSLVGKGAEGGVGQKEKFLLPFRNAHLKHTTVFPLCFVWTLLNLGLSKIQKLGLNPET